MKDRVESFKRHLFTSKEMKQNIEGTTCEELIKAIIIKSNLLEKQAQNKVLDNMNKR